MSEILYISFISFSVNAEPSFSTMFVSGHCMVFFLSLRTSFIHAHTHIHWHLSHLKCACFVHIGQLKEQHRTLHHNHSMKCREYCLKMFKIAFIPFVIIIVVGGLSCQDKKVPDGTTKISVEKSMTKRLSILHKQLYSSVGKCLSTKTYTQQKKWISVAITTNRGVCVQTHTFCLKSMLSPFDCFQSTGFVGLFTSMMAPSHCLLSWNRPSLRSFDCCCWCCWQWQNAGNVLLFMFQAFNAIVFKY